MRNAPPTSLAAVPLMTQPPPATLPTLPRGHVGLWNLPGTNRRIWWTGRVAIGLRYQRPAHDGMTPSSAVWVQDLLLNPSSAR